MASHLQGRTCGVAGERRENLPHRSSATISLCHILPFLQCGRGSAKVRYSVVRCRQCVHGVLKLISSTTVLESGPSRCHVAHQSRVKILHLNQDLIHKTMTFLSVGRRVHTHLHWHCHDKSKRNEVQNACALKKSRFPSPLSRLTCQIWIELGKSHPVPRMEQYVFLQHPAILEDRHSAG